MIRVIIVDDEPLALVSMKKHLNEFDNIEVIRTFTTAKDVLKEGPTLDFQVAFLDVEMPGMSGLEVAQLLKTWDKNICIIFVTAYRDYAVQAFDVQSLDYLLKPVSKSRLEITINRIQKLFQKNLSSEKTRTHQKPMLQIRCFGEFVVSFDDKVIHWRTIKSKELFAFLFLQLHMPVPRDNILDSLWSDTDVKKARVQLHTTVSYLRTTLSFYGYTDVIEYANGCYILKLNDFQCDAFDLEDILNTKAETGRLNIEKAEELIQNYHDEFMATMDYAWTTSKANLMNKQFSQLLDELILYYSKNKNLKNRERSLLFALEFNPYSDKIVQQLIQHYTEIGNRAEAIKIYHSFNSLLLTELNVSPSQETTELFQNVLHAHEKEHETSVYP
ncbi:response regulator [Lysinibacillus sp. OL1_EC]|uniref:response regulator n=1 Tax=unclassified Lysinibacillus TaxID=2636778 RepID=UPI00103BC077|nr:MULTISPECIES: response regulator [unclassified Lysinibacillus]MCM0624541.1 response regulator [Lysinibacillus sp. OL1_EC]TBV87883.1 response regulator [Lysinibacillus sp. OL1]UKJ45778.1 response regulator [Lysinibacillus sp. ACHW1.5]WGT39212.1 response regulator [Lysinibacillus sp. 1 U-2021]